MSKTSYVLIFIMIAALAYVGAVRGYQFYQHKVQESEEEKGYDYGFSFQNVPVSFAPPMPEAMSTPIPFPEEPREIFLEEPALSAQDQQKQAQDTIHSILEDYQDETIQAFNQELSDITQGQVNSLEVLSGGEVVQLLQQNPQIASVVEKHMKNPDFARTIQQIFSNPQFIKSAKILQDAANKPAASEDKKTE